jgi:hypothetical protein
LNTLADQLLAPLDFWAQKTGELPYTATVRGICSSCASVRSTSAGRSGG